MSMDPFKITFPEKIPSMKVHDHDDYSRKAVSPLSGGWFHQDSNYLQSFGSLDKIIVKRRIVTTKLSDVWEPTFNYTLLNKKGHELYYISEEPNPQRIVFMQGFRPKIFKLFDVHNREVACLNIGPFRMPFCWCWPAFLPQIEIFSGRNLLGSVHALSFWKSKFSVRDEANQNVFNIKGSSSQLTKNFFMKISTVNKPSSRIGYIDRDWMKWSRRGIPTLDDIFEITVPMELDCKMKAVILSGSILMDVMFHYNYQRTQDKDN